VRPCLLLLLARGPAHGYELTEAIARCGLNDAPPDSGGVYRTLRQMERDGLVQSHWQPTESGPARRVYALTEAGEAALHVCAACIRARRERLETFLRTYEARFPTEAPET